ncbi:MAG: hypothetical protein PHN49_11690, partial [Candidatus Omnitrophica bacterium]|nr:hypothetical protein [Candidatus Omnitrophota bacterium]
MGTKSVIVRKKELIIAGILIALFLFSASSLMAAPENAQRLAAMADAPADGVPLDNIQSRDAELEVTHLRYDLNSSSHMVRALQTSKNFKMASTASYGAADANADGATSNTDLEHKLAYLMEQSKAEKAAENRMLTVNNNNQEKESQSYNKSPELTEREKEMEAAKDEGLPSGHSSDIPAVAAMAYGRNLSEKAKNEEKSDKINDGMILPELTKGQPLENQMAASQVEIRFKMPAERFAVLEGKSLPKNQLENFATQKGNAG